MPLYEYRCKKCSKTFEMLQKINTEPLANCIFCQGNAERLISVSSFRLKGSGWYISDYKKKSTESKPKLKSNTKKTGESKDAAVK